MLWLTDTEALTKIALRCKNNLWILKISLQSCKHSSLHAAVIMKLNIAALSSHLRNPLCFQMTGLKMYGHLSWRTPMCEIFTDRETELRWLCSRSAAYAHTHKHTRTQTHPHTLYLCKWYVCSFIEQLLKASLVLSSKTLACMFLWAGNGLVHHSISYIPSDKIQHFPVEPNI